MAEFENLGLRAGVWYGVLTGEAPSRVFVSHLGQPIAEAAVDPAGEGRFDVTAPLPADVLNDGVQTLLMVAEAGEGQLVQRLGQISLLSGEVLEEDLRAEISLLRAELDLLKREFRRLAE